MSENYQLMATLSILNSHAKDSPKTEMLSVLSILILIVLLELRMSHSLCFVLCAAGEVRKFWGGMEL